MNSKEQSDDVATPIVSPNLDGAGPGAEEKHLRTRGRGRRRTWWVATVALFCVSGAVWWCWAPAKSAATGAGSPTAASIRDVPYVEGKVVAFSEAFAQRTGIKLSTVLKAPVARVVKVVGTVDFDPRRVAAVGARTQGFVRRVMRLPGDVVKAGDPLAEIESAGLGQAQADLAVARARGRAAETNATREVALLKEGLTTAREAEVASAALASHKASLEAAQQRVLALGGKGPGRLGIYILRAPLSGSIVESRVSVGQPVEADVVAFRVANLDDLWVELSVFERTIGMIRVGDAVKLTPMADVKKVIRGRVAHVSEVLDLSTRSGKIRVQVDNRNRLLRPGQSVEAVIHTVAPARDCLSVPFKAVTYVDGKPTVFVADGLRRVIPTIVQLGVCDGEQQEVVSGVNEGESVVSEGVFALKSELFR